MMKSENARKFQPDFAKVRVRALSKEPNKAPEPTTTAVTPRAFMFGVFDSVTGARGAPAVVVAHL